MSITAKGPFEIQWRGNILTDIESIDYTHDVDSEDYKTVDGRNYTIYGSHKVTVELTFLGQDVAALAVVLPQYFVADGGTLSTGERVGDADGALDIVPGGCNVTTIYGNLDIISCGNPGKVLRLVNAYSEISGVEFDDKIRKVSVIFVASPASGDAVSQFFEESSITYLS